MKKQISPKSKAIASMTNAIRHIVPAYLQVSPIKEVVNISGIAIEYIPDGTSGRKQTIYVTDQELAAISAADKRIGYTQKLSTDSFTC